MFVETRIFDPNGDVILIFPWHEEDQPVAPTTTANTKAVASVEDLTTALNGLSTGSLADGEPESLQQDPRKDVHMLVSSKHMMLASTVFAAMLSVNFREGSDLQSRGKTEITLPDDDPDAFTVLLDIIHGRTRKVPRQFHDLVLLTNLAVLVDKYQMLEAVEFFSTTWLAVAMADIPKALPGDLLLWLCVSWIFRSSSDFVSISQILMRTSDGVIGADMEEELPIPETILKEINTRRQKAIYEALEMIHLLMESRYPIGYCKRTDGRASACDAMLLGSLLRSCQKTGLWPPPVAPYKGLTFDALKAKISSFEIQTLCGTTNELYKHHNSLKFGSELKKGLAKGIIDEEMISLESGLSGIDIEYFLSDNRHQ